MAMNTPDPNQPSESDELDKILGTVYYRGQAEDSINATGGDMSAEKAIKQAKQAIQALYAKPTTILSKPIDEVITILSALELERIEDLKMTMSNLSEW